MSLGDVLLGTLVPAAGVGGVVLNGWWAKRGGEEVAKNAANHNQAIDWQAHVDDIRAWTEVRLSALSQDIAARDARIDRLEQDVSAVRTALTGLQRKYRVALAYIGRLHYQLQQHVDPEDLEAPPEEIRSDL